MAWNLHEDSLYSNFLYHPCVFVWDVLEGTELKNIYTENNSKYLQLPHADP